MLTRTFLAKVFFISDPYQYYLKSIKNTQTLNDIKLRVPNIIFF